MANCDLSTWDKICVHRAGDLYKCSTKHFKVHHSSCRVGLDEALFTVMTENRTSGIRNTAKCTKRDSADLSTSRNCDGSLEAVVQFDIVQPTHMSIGVEVPSYEIIVYSGKGICFRKKYRSPVLPAITFYKSKPNILVVCTYPTDDFGAVLQAYDVTSGSLVWVRCFNDICADWNAVVDIVFDRKGSRLVLCVKEETCGRTQYLTRFFVVDISSLNLIQKSKAWLLRVCHQECLKNVTPILSVCDGYLCLPSLSGAIVERLPEESSLKEIARKTVLRTITGNIDHALQRLDIPWNLKRFLVFE